MSENIRLYISKSYKGLNMGDIYWNTHNQMAMADIEELPEFYGWLHFTDIDTNPTIKNVYADDAGVDGSRFEYNSLQKTPVKLSFYFEFDSYEDYMSKKHDVQSYFAAKSVFTIETSYRPAVKANCFVSKVDIKPTSDHIAVFDVTMDNASGMWFTNPTSRLQKDWYPELAYDLRLPTNLRGVPSWDLQPGHNNIYIPGDLMVQMTNPIMYTAVFLHGASSKVSVINHTSNTTLSADLQGQPGGELAWMNLDFVRVTGVNESNGAVSADELNQYSNSLDFWLDPGWNDIELQGASSGSIDTRCYFTTI